MKIQVSAGRPIPVVGLYRSSAGQLRELQAGEPAPGDRELWWLIALPIRNTKGA